MNADDSRATGIFTVPLIWLFIAGILFSALICLERELILLCACFFGVVGLSWAWSRLSPKGVRFDVGLDRDRVFPGESTSLKVALKNDKILPVWISLSIPTPANGRMSCEADASGFDAALPGHGSTGFEWPLALHKRGVYNLGPNRIVTGDLLGLFPKTKKAGIEKELIVYPKLIPLVSQSVAKTEIFGFPGSRSPVTDPVYIVGTRDYQASSPARFIHWRASARHRRWQEKLFQPSSREKIVLALDTRGFAEDQDEGGFENALEVLASLAVEFDEKGIRAGFISNGAIRGKSPYGVVSAGPRKVLHILETLARLEIKPAAPLHELIQVYGPSLGAGVFVLFCRRVDEEIRYLKSLLEKKRKKVVVMTGADAISTDERPPEGVFSIDGIVRNPGS